MLNLHQPQYQVNDDKLYLPKIQRILFQSPYQHVIFHEYHQDLILPIVRVKSVHEGILFQ